MATSTKSTDSDSVLLNQIVNQGVNIYGSREKIRSALIEYAKQYLNLNDSDINKTSYLAYLIDQLSILSANHIFYDATIYKEFFFVDAQLTESVSNLAKWIGYVIPKAVPAQVDLLMGVNLEFTTSQASFTISPYFHARAGDIPFMIKSDSLDSVSAAKVNVNNTLITNEITAKVINNSILNVRDSDGNYKPVYLSSDGKTAYFYLTFIQKDIQLKIFNVPDDLSTDQYYNIPIEYEGQVSDLDVYVISPTINQKLNTSSSSIDGTLSPETFDPTEEMYDSAGNICNWVKWEEAVNGIYSMTAKKTQYCWVGGYNKGEIMFGNGILGKQPAPGSIIAVRLHITQGSTGNVISNTISDGDTIYQNSSSGTGTVSFTINNPSAAYGGSDLLTLPEIKQNAIVNLSSKKRLVSDNDYDDITTICGDDLPIKNAYPILKRSDIKCNEMMVFTTLNYIANNVNEIVPTRNTYIDISNTEWTSDSNEFTIMRNTDVVVGNDTFITLFNMTLNRTTKTASYDYMLQSVDGTSVSKYSKIRDSFYDKYSYITGNGCSFSINTSRKSTLSTNYAVNVTFKVNHNVQENSTIDNENNMTAYQLKNLFDNYGGFNVQTFQATMTTKWGDNKVYDATAAYGYTYTKNSDGAYTSFGWTIDNYLNVPDGLQRFEFDIEAWGPKRNLDGSFVGTDGSIIIDAQGNLVSGKSNTKVQMAWSSLHTYYCDVIIRRNLDTFMESTITFNEDGSCRLHNVPVILKSYYKDIVESDSNTGSSNFELSVMQKLMTSLSFTDKKMLTDFINIKFCDTYGVMTNLKYNTPSYTVESRYDNTPWWDSDTQSIPTDVIINTDYGSGSKTDPAATAGQSGIYYIANGFIDEMGKTPLSEYLGYIVLRLVSGDAPNYTYTYQLIEPKRGMYVRVKDELDSDGYYNTLVWTGRTWKNVSEYNIPLDIKVKIEVDNTVVSKSDETITNEIIDALTTYYQSKIGIQKNIDISELLKVCRSISGVVYAEILNPEFNIRFDYTIDDLTQKQMLDFTPQYIGFRGKSSNESDYSKSTVTVQIERV